jgi:hypothetical protein
MMTLLAGLITYEFKALPNLQIIKKKAKPIFQLAKQNWFKIWKYLRLPFIYKPIIFIFLVVIAPGVDDAMFYFNNNVLHFDSDIYANINLIDSVGNILGVWTFRLAFYNTSFKKMLIISTICFAITQSSKLIVVLDLTESIFGIEPATYTYITSWCYSFVNELHLMPLMVLACKMCPKSVEASFYAFVLAIINAGYLISY